MMNLLLSAPATIEEVELGIGQGLSYSLLGIAVVFAMLFALMIVIKIMGALLGEKPKKADDAAAAKVDTAPAQGGIPAGKVPAPGSLGDIAIHDVPEKTAAMIMAIVADEMNTPLNELRFKSIKRVD